MLRLFKVLTVVSIILSSTLCAASTKRPAGATFYKVKNSLWSQGIHGAMASDIPNINMLDAGEQVEAPASDKMVVLPEELTRALLKMHNP